MIQRWLPNFAHTSSSHVPLPVFTSKLKRRHLSGTKKIPIKLCRSNGSDGSNQGNPKVQDELLDMIEIGIAKAKVKEDILKDLEERKERMRKIGQELQDDFGKRIELDKARLNLATNYSLADINQQFQELDDEVQRIRDDLKADRKDLAKFEKESTSARNNYLFFKGLYKSDDEKEEDEELDEAARQLKEAEVQEVRRQTVEAVKASSREEVHSPLRLALFVYLAVILFFVIVEDASGDSPSWGLDTLYGALCVILGANAWNERRALVQQEHQVQQELQKARGASEDRKP